MRPITRLSYRISLVVILACLACSDEGQVPSGPGEGLTASAQPLIPGSLQNQIDALFTGGPRKAAIVHIRNILRQAGRGEDVQDKLAGFIEFATAQFVAGHLTDPEGPNSPPTRAEALASLVSAVAQSAGPDFPSFSETVFTDGAVGRLGPAGGTVIANTGFAGLHVPSGALPEDVLVVIQRLPEVGSPQERGGPLPTDLDQYPRFYDISLFPETELLEDVVVGICVVDPPDPFAPAPEIASRLRLGHPDPDNPAETEILPLADASFLNCEIATASNRLSPSGRHLATSAPGSLGGRVSAFSPFAAVDPQSEPETILELAAGTFTYPDGVGTAFIFNPTTALGAVSSITITGPPGWLGGSSVLYPNEIFPHQRPGFASDKAIWWLFSPAVTGDYLGTATVAGETLQRSFSIDATSILAPPTIDDFSYSSNFISVSWANDPGHVSYYLWLIGPSFGPHDLLFEAVLPATVDTYTFPELALMPGELYEVVIFALSTDVRVPGPISARFNIAADGAQLTIE